MLEEIRRGSSVAQPPERVGRLGADFIFEVAQRADQHREGAVGVHIAQDIGGPGASMMPAALLQEIDHRLDDMLTVAGEDVSHAWRQPHLGVAQRLDQRCHGARVGNAGQCPKRDLPYVGILGAGVLHRLQQGRHG